MTEKKEEKKLNIYQRIGAVMEDVKYVQKSNAAKGIPYKSVKHDDVMGALHMPLVKHGIVVVPSVIEMTQDGNRTVAKIEVAFVNIDDPEDRFSVVYYGYGVDTQDKGPGKAYSYAVKYALLKTFCLETGDDPERENVDYKANVISEDQVQELELKINGNEELRKQILQHVPGNKLENLTTDRFQAVLNWIEKVQGDSNAN